MKQEWLLLDMHLHSFYSKNNKPSESDRVRKMSAKEFVDILLSKNVKIFSITDHNYFSKFYYDEIEKYIDDNNLDMKIINGVELDVYVTLKNGTSDYIHICVYFDNNLDRGKLEEKINSLYKDEKGNLLNPDFVEILNKLYELKSKFIVIPHGDKARGLFKKNKIDKLNFREQDDYYKYAMYKIFNAYDVSPGFFGKSETFWATNFYEKTKKFEDLASTKTLEEMEVIKNHLSDKIKGIDVSLTNKEQLLYDYLLKFGAYFSYFNFSDWHNNEPYNPETNNFIFGTLETAFESFEMATLDPVSRITVSEDNEIQIPSTILNKVSFKIGDKTKQVLFSPGLNAIVGKRGSGKSLLLSVIRNLVDKNDKLGALNNYKKLQISDIKAENRDGIPISLGGLNSVAFLTQDEIKDIFENPENAQKTISNYFINIKDIDIEKINDLLAIGEKILPINENYKNLTSNILAIRRNSDYNYSELNEISDVEVKLNFNTLLSSLKDTIDSINRIGINTEELKDEMQKLLYLKDSYLEIIRLYNLFIQDSNLRIKDINSKRTSNQITQRQNTIDINNALEEIKNNFEIQLNVEKFKYILNNLSIESPQVEVFRKGKYLFVTYYQIPENINNIIIDEVLSSITRASSIDDINKYILNNTNRKLKTNFDNVVSGLKKYVKNNEIFKPKKEFYEIKNEDIDYKKIIKSVKILEDNVRKGNLINLTNASPGMKSVAYLDMLFDLEETILILDQPEDNIDNDYISNYLVPNIKNKKRIKQLIFVTHNPSVAVYGDAFNYIFAEYNEEITYENFMIEKTEDKERLIRILEGGRPSFSNRNKKFGNVLGEEEYGNN